MDVIETLFGSGKDLNALQMCCRAFVIYFICLLYIRLAGRRAFGKVSTFDNVIAITLGAVLSRAIVGVSPFFPVLACSFLLVLLHRAVGWITMKNHQIGKVIKGDPLSLYKDGQFNENNLRASYISRRDLMEGVRDKLGENNLENVEEVVLERNGEFSILKKKEE